MHYPHVLLNLTLELPGKTQKASQTQAVHFMVVNKLRLDRYIGLPILLANIGLSQIYRYRYIHSLKSAHIKTVILGWKKAGTSDLKWCNHIVCPAEGSPLFIW